MDEQKKKQTAFSALIFITRKYSMWLYVNCVYKPINDAATFSKAPNYDIPIVYSHFIYFQFVYQLLEINCWKFFILNLY